MNMLPPCLRRSGFAQAGLKLHHPTTHSASVRNWNSGNYDTVSRRKRWALFHQHLPISLYGKGNVYKPRYAFLI